MENTTEFKDALEVERNRLITALSTLAVHNQVTDDWELNLAGDPLDETDESLVADAAEAAETDISILAELENEYRHIQIALQKIEAGTYGICEMSGEIIDIDRLRANPAARTCREHMNDESQLPM